MRQQTQAAYAQRQAVDFSSTDSNVQPAGEHSRKLILQSLKFEKIGVKIWKNSDTGDLK